MYISTLVQAHIPTLLELIHIYFCQSFSSVYYFSVITESRKKKNESQKKAGTFCENIACFSQHKQRTQREWLGAGWPGNIDFEFIPRPDPLSPRHDPLSAVPHRSSFVLSLLDCYILPHTRSCFSLPRSSDISIYPSFSVSVLRGYLHS